MAIQIGCPNCQESYRLPETQLGKRVRCRKCGDTFLVEQEEDVPVLEEATAEDVRRYVTAHRRDRALAAAPSRRGRDDDDFDRDRDDEDGGEEPQEKKSNTGLILMLGGAALVLFLMLVGGGVAAFLLFAPSKTGVATSQPSAATGADFNKAFEEARKAAERGKRPGFNQGGKGPAGFAPPPRVEETKPPTDVTTALQALKGNRTGQEQGLKFLAAAPVEEGRRAEVESALVSLLDDQPAQANNIFPAMRRWAPKAALERLVRRVKDNNPFTAAKAMEELGQIDDDQAAEALVGQLKVFGRGRDASQALERMGKRAVKFVLPLYNDKDSTVRNHARDVLKTLNASSDEIFRQTVADLESTENEQRKQAVEELAKHKPSDKDLQDRVAQSLAGLVTSRYADLADRSLTALETWATTSTVPALLEALDAPGKTDKVLKVLAGLKDERVIKPLALRLNSPQRLAIARILVSYGPAAEQDVQVQLSNRDQQTRVAAVEILAEVGTSKSIKLLQRYGRAHQGAEARLALAAIKKINQREKSKMTKPKDKSS
jgi:predicted Zn finger-like uncharacterized protein